MDKELLREVAHSKYGEFIRDILDEYIIEVTDIRNVEVVSESEMLGRKKAADILTDIRDRLSDRGRPEPNTSEFE